MIWIGAIICVLTFVGIILKFDTKLCLIGGGFLMCLLAGAVGEVVPAYSKSLINGSVVYLTVISMGYAAIMDKMGCCDHLIYACLRPISKVKALILPFSVGVTIVIIMGMGSAATVGATAGSLLIPVMTALGVSPAVAAAAVLQGTCLSVPVNPGASFTVMAAEADPNGIVTGKDIVSKGFTPSLITMIVGIAVFSIIGTILSKKDKNVDKDAMEKALAAAGAFKVNPLYAILPIVPLTLILLAVYGPLPEEIFSVAGSMMIGWVLCMIIFRDKYKEVANAFFKGQGDSFYSVITLMAAAAVFTKGMSAIGITTSLVEAMKANPSIAKLGGAYGPMLIAALSGSGNAATIAFCESVLPHAEEIGIDFTALACVVLKSGPIGRTFSPVAAVTIIVARIANVQPMDVIKVTVIPCLVAITLQMILQLGL